MGVLKIFENFTRKHLRWSSLKNKVIKKRHQHRCFRVKFPTFLTEHIRGLFLGAGIHDNTKFYSKFVFMGLQESNMKELIFVFS